MGEWESNATLEHPSGAFITPRDTVLALQRFPADAVVAPTPCSVVGPCRAAYGWGGAHGRHTVSAVILEPLDDACAMMVHALEVRSGAGADMRDR